MNSKEELVTVLLGNSAKFFGQPQIAYNSTNCDVAIKIIFLLRSLFEVTKFIRTLLLTEGFNLG